MPDYPIKFHPILKEKIWGGEKLLNLLNKSATHKNTGESWEISGVSGDISIVANGIYKNKALNELQSELKEKLVGRKVFEKFGEEFPLLIKFIDAKTALSVQLHPNDDLAKTRHNSFGKTEMWYIMQADPGANIIIGFKDTVSKEKYLTSLKEDRVTELLNFEEVKNGDSFFIHTGNIHAIGAGVLLAEIQQTSDITYRIYDWDRKDELGNSRELHIDLALDAINFKRRDDFKLNYARSANQATNIATCKYFTTNFLPVEGNLIKDYSNIDSFIILMCVSGGAQISIDHNSEPINMGQSILIPAITGEVSFKCEKAEFLEIYID
ncbi:class I mannose-6-phosphate isomerase [soil metagenome]